MTAKIIGTTTDWKGYDEAVKERYELNPDGTSHCTLHNTFFDLRDEDGEPCWQCYDEFTTVLTKKGEE